jgi:hypothetical protein
VRPEKLKHEMAKDGTLANLYVQMREQKAIDKILESAEIEDVDVVAEKKKDEEKKADKKSKKNSKSEKSEEAKEEQTEQKDE